MPAHGAAVIAEDVARRSYGRLVALLASRSGDLAAAEDALSIAFARALETWPVRGVPENPEGWLLTVARNRQLDVSKSAVVRTAVPIETTPTAELPMATIDPDDMPDERLKLLFVCVHPAIDPQIRCPLMLQTVLGIEADAIGRAFLVPEAAMAQRLVRAKRKIKDARIPFEMPSRSDMGERLDAVLEAVYGAYAIGWDTPQIGDADLGAEALFLVELLASLMPDNPEVLGLAALILHGEARRSARVSSGGQFVPLEDHDTGLWDHVLIHRAEALLQRARTSGSIGRFQLEAAIQSVHAHRVVTGVTDWAALELLYEGLIRIAPGVGTAVGRAIAVGRVRGPLAGLACLSQIETTARDTYQPAVVVRAHLLAEAGHAAEAREAYERAIKLTVNPVIRAFLTAKLHAVPSPAQH
jgi:RNA polymerase sigma-70 factor, ECF subfamily